LYRYGMAAAKAGHAHVVQELMGRMRGDAATVGYFDGGDTRGMTALSLACRNGRVDVAGVLLQGGAGVDERSGAYAMTPLMHAACKGQTATVEFLLTANGASVDASAKDDNGMCAVLHAAAGGSVGCFQALAKAWPRGVVGAREERDSKGRNALMLAARFGGKEMCRYLLDSGEAGL
jgi:ankyrin repeat protein